MIETGLAETHLKYLEGEQKIYEDSKVKIDKFSLKDQEKNKRGEISIEPKKILEVMSNAQFFSKIEPKNIR